VFCPLLSSSKIARVPEDSQFPLFGSVSLILTLASKCGCNRKFVKKQHTWSSCNSSLVNLRLKLGPIHLNLLVPSGIIATITNPKALDLPLSFWCLLAMLVTVSEAFVVIMLPPFKSFCQLDNNLEFVSTITPKTLEFTYTMQQMFNKNSSSLFCA
jgi:hypothetical protein